MSELKLKFKVLIGILSGVLGLTLVILTIIFLVPDNNDKISKEERIYFMQSLLVFDYINTVDPGNAYNETNNQIVGEINESMLFIEHVLFTSNNNAKVLKNEDPGFDKKMKFNMYGLNSGKMKFEYLYKNIDGIYNGRIIYDESILKFDSQYKDEVYTTTFIYNDKKYEVLSLSLNDFRLSEVIEDETTKETSNILFFIEINEENLFLRSLVKYEFSVVAGKIVCEVINDNQSNDNQSETLDISIDHETGNYQYKFREAKNIFFVERFK